MTDTIVFTMNRDPTYNCNDMLELVSPMQPDLSLNYTTEPSYISIEKGFLAFIEDT